jgi:hypothetical protein
MCAASVATSKIYAWLYEHKTLGRDKEIGIGEVDVMPFFFIRLKQQFAHTFM